MGIVIFTLGLLFFVGGWWVLGYGDGRLGVGLIICGIGLMLLSLCFEILDGVIEMRGKLKKIEKKLEEWDELMR